MYDIRITKNIPVRLFIVGILLTMGILSVNPIAAQFLDSDADTMYTIGQGSNTNSAWAIGGNSNSILVINSSLVTGTPSFTSTYAYASAIKVTNSCTYSVTLRPYVAINAYGLITGNFMQSDADDVTIVEGGSEELLSAGDLTSNAANWLLAHDTIPGGATVVKTMYFGDPTATRDQQWISDDGDTLTISGTPALDQMSTMTLRASVYLDTLPTTGTASAIINKSGAYELAVNSTPQFTFRACTGTPVATCRSATIAATLNTWHNLVATLSGGTLSLTNGTLADSVAHSGTTSPTTGIDIDIADYDGYADNYSIASSGTLASFDFEPEDINTTTIDDLTNGYDISYTLASIPACITVSVGGAESTGDLFPTAEELEAIEVLPESWKQPRQTQEEIDALGSGHILFPFVDLAHSMASIPYWLSWLFIYLLVVLLVMTEVFKRTNGHIAISGLSGLVTTAIFYAWGQLIPWALLAMFVLAWLVSLILERRQTI